MSEAELDRKEAIRIWHKHCDAFSSVLGSAPPACVINAMLDFAATASKQPREASVVSNSLTANSTAGISEPSSAPEPLSTEPSTAGKSADTDDPLGQTAYGRAALRKLGAVPQNFRLYSAGWQGKTATARDSMRVAGREFRAGRDGRLNVPVPGTIQVVIVTADEIRAERRGAS